jgi:hypothetical protein
VQQRRRSLADESIKKADARWEATRGKL